jgi:hypothetical protein
MSFCAVKNGRSRLVLTAVRGFKRSVRLSSRPVGRAASWSRCQLVALPVGRATSWWRHQLVALPVGRAASWSRYQLVALPVILRFYMDTSVRSATVCATAGSTTYHSVFYLSLFFSFVVFVRIGTEVLNIPLRASEGYYRMHSSVRI